MNTLFTQGQHYLVSTDLDGTLLDHFSYSWLAAKQSLDLLKQHKIPLILNTSKTFDEVKQLQRDLELDVPFIVENGSAIYLPKSFVVDGSTQDYDTSFNRWVSGVLREVVVEELHALRLQYGWKFEGYSDWDTEKIMNLTGLDEASAKKSQARQFSEPLVWSDTEQNFKAFNYAVKHAGLRLIKGGRFIHVLGQSDKGKAVLDLCHLMYGENHSTQIICLGDSHNDLDMLRIADYPVLIKSPAHDYPPHTEIDSVYLTKQCGPEGWHEAITRIFKS